MSVKIVLVICLYVFVNNTHNGIRWKTQKEYEHRNSELVWGNKRDKPMPKTDVGQIATISQS